MNTRAVLHLNFALWVLLASVLVVPAIAQTPSQATSTLPPNFFFSLGMEDGLIYEGTQVPSLSANDRQDLAKAAGDIAMHLQQASAPNYVIQAAKDLEAFLTSNAPWAPNGGGNFSFAFVQYEQRLDPSASFYAGLGQWDSEYLVELTNAGSSGPAPKMMADRTRAQQSAQFKEISCHALQCPSQVSADLAAISKQFEIGTFPADRQELLRLFTDIMDQFTQPSQASQAAPSAGRAAPSSQKAGGETEAARHYGLGSALYAKGDYLGAISEFRESLRLDPNNAVTHRELGSSLYRANA